MSQRPDEIATPSGEPVPAPRRPGAAGPPQPCVELTVSDELQDIEDLIEVSVLRWPTAIVVSVRGEVDLVSAPPLQRELVEQLENAGTLLVLDLTEVTFLSSAGLSLLYEVGRRAADRGVGFRLVVNTRPVLHPLTVTGLAAELDVRPSIEEALN
ncbi:hypothetical protein GCM10012275_15920 [Longimycelium tulufanense]|uniref:Anti-sigma factor antagonist n=1 Tax=Longimycelium tulufanense TaxID=907463 RepID=A0A8J3C716_9PSEU|nr:STAS domain-containing protein [Longimycelium tulufanense]GGM45694.1 hypothetical protein GCM10012275_15920 [Longimycelium tulufanense]